MDKQDQPGDKPEVKPDDQKIVIGDVELTPDEAKDLITQGKTFKELADKYPDIDFKELPKSFTQTRQELADLKKPKKAEENLDDDEVARRKQIKDFFQDPLVKEELKNLTTQESNTLKEDLEFNKRLESLETEFDGSDGRPKFERKAVLEYGMKNQIFNPRTSYKEMHEAELEEWTIKQALAGKRPTTFSEKKGGAGAKQPEPKVPTNFREATEAALQELE